jgi:hypothetical protein
MGVEVIEGRVGAIARLLRGLKGRKLGGGHQTRQLEDALECAYAATEIGKLRGLQSAEGSRGHRAVASAQRLGSQGAEWGVIRKGSPTSMAVERGGVADRDSKEVNLRASAVGGEGRADVGDRRGTEVAQGAGPFLN